MKSITMIVKGLFLAGLLAAVPSFGMWRGFAAKTLGSAARVATASSTKTAPVVEAVITKAAAPKKLVTCDELRESLDRTTTMYKALVQEYVSKPSIEDGFEKINTSVQNNVFSYVMSLIRPALSGKYREEFDGSVKKAIPSSRGYTEKSIMWDQYNAHLEKTFGKFWVFADFTDSVAKEITVETTNQSPRKEWNKYITTKGCLENPIVKEDVAKLTENLERCCGEDGFCTDRNYKQRKKNMFPGVHFTGCCMEMPLKRLNEYFNHTGELETLQIEAAQRQMDSIKQLAAPTRDIVVKK